MSAPLVIIGSGLAGYTLAREWRKLDPTTPLVVVSRDDAGFYSKPMLSNALAGGKTPSSLVMKPAATMAADLKAEVLARTEVVGADPAERRLSLRLADGSARELVYAQLVLAVGADPIRLPLEGAAASHVQSVNDLDDLAAFLDRLEGAQRVAILGAGLIGCEFANDLLARGIAPTVFDPAEAPLSRLLPPEASALLRERLEQAGVRFVLGRSVRSVEPGPAGAGFSLRLDDGSHDSADAVLSAVGLRPRTGLAQQLGAATARGVVVNRLLETSVPGVHALGDCAELQAEGQSLVLPYVMPIMQQARALAATLAGTPTPVQYPAMPVTVKTPACPTVVCPPPQGATGGWTVERGQDDTGAASCTARHLSATGELQGFALLGSATAQRMALAKLLPPLLG